MALLLRAWPPAPPAITWVGCLFSFSRRRAVRANAMDGNDGADTVRQSGRDAVDRKTSARDWGKFTHLCLLRAPPCSSRGVRGRHVQRCGGASCKSHLPMAIVTGQLGSPMKMTRTSVQEDPRASWHCTGRLADTEQLQLSAAAWHNNYSSYACRVDSGNCESS